MVAYNSRGLFSHSFRIYVWSEGVDRDLSFAKVLKTPPLPLAGSGGLRHSLASGRRTPISTSVFTWLSSPCVCLCLCIHIFFLKEQSHTEVTVSLTNLTLLRSKSHSVMSLCDTVDYTVHGILWARILEWVFPPSPGNLPIPGIKPRSPTLQVDSLLAESPGKPKNMKVGSLSLLQGIFLTQESTGVFCIAGRFFTS